MQSATDAPGEVDRVPPTGIRDPSNELPLCAEDEFDELVAEVVANEAPRLFAVVAEYGTRVDAKCVAWGMVFENGAYAVSVDGRRHFALDDPDAALKYFRVVGSVSTRLVWPDPSKILPREHEED